MFVESKLSFDISSISIKANIELSGERIEKYLETFLNPRWSAGINDRNFILLSNVRNTSKWKKVKRFCNTGLKTNVFMRKRRT